MVPEKKKEKKKKKKNKRSWACQADVYLFQMQQAVHFKILHVAKYN